MNFFYYDSSLTVLYKVPKSNAWVKIAIPLENDFGESRLLEYNFSKSLKSSWCLCLIKSFCYSHIEAVAQLQI